MFLLIFLAKVYKNLYFVNPAASDEVKRDEFWDYDHQVDLEAFSTEEFYNYLSTQARQVTGELGRQKEEVGKCFQ